MKSQTVALFIYLGIAVALIGYLERYELGLKKPTFKVGDCVLEDLSNEFKEDHATFQVTKVGKKSYLMKFYRGDIEIDNFWEPTATFEVADGKLKKIECPAITLEDVGE